MSIPLAKLKPPRMGHNWLIDFTNISEDQKKQVRVFINSVSLERPCFTEPKEWSVLREAQPWVQGDQDNWLRVEFWADSQDLILQASEILANKVQLPLELD